MAKGEGEVKAGEKGEMKQSTLKVTKENPDGSTDESEEVLDETVYTQPTCNIGLSAGMTVNVGNFNNVKFQVSLFAPCYPQEVHEVFDNVKAFVDEKVGELHDEVTKAYGLSK